MKVAVILTLQLVLIVAICTPYVWNFAKLVDCDFESDYKCEVIHGLGAVIPPAALITVWFDDDSNKSK